MVARRKATATTATVEELKQETKATKPEIETETDEQETVQNSHLVENGDAEVSVTAANETLETTNDKNEGEDSTINVNGTMDDTNADESKADDDKPLEKTFENDSAAVVQHLSQLRLSVGPLTLEQIHDSSLLPIFNACSGYQIHTPRVLNLEVDKTKYAMLDIEFLTAESAKENKEALQKHFESCNTVKIDNWPENKIYYNDYSYLEIDEKIITRMKDGVLIAGYSKLRDRWLVAVNVDADVSIDKIKELVGNDCVDTFRKEDKRKVYIRFDTKESAKAAIDKSTTINGKTIKLKELTVHPSEKKGFRNFNYSGNNSFRGGRGGSGRGGGYFNQSPMPPMPYNQMYPYPPQQPQYGYYGAQQPPQNMQSPRRMDMGYYSHPSSPYYGGNPQFQQKRPRY